MTEDTVCVQYNFLFDPNDAFIQEEGTICWLEVVAMNGSGNWGWKTADPDIQPHFNDDAVWMDDDWSWQELRYPAEHGYEGESIDLAFVITPEPATMGLLMLGSLGLAALRKRRRK